MLNLGDVRIGLYNWVIIGLMAMLFIVLMKMLMTKFPVPGLAEVVHSA